MHTVKAKDCVLVLGIEVLGVFGIWYRRLLIECTNYLKVVSKVR